MCDACMNRAREFRASLNAEQRDLLDAMIADGIDHAAELSVAYAAADDPDIALPAARAAVEELSLAIEAAEITSDTPLGEVLERAEAWKKIDAALTHAREVLGIDE